MSLDIELRVDGQVYVGWTSASISLGIEQMAGAFGLELTRRWPGVAAVRPVRPGALCEVFIGQKKVITGYVDEDRARLDATSSGFSVAGRSRTADLIDCAAIHASGQWSGRTLTQIASDLARPFGISVRAETNVGAPFPTFSLQEGETVFDALDRAARLRGVLLSSDAEGNLVILRARTVRSPGELVEGRNLLSVNVSRSMRDRFSRYLVKGQARGDDQDFGQSVAGPSALVSDAAVPRYRPTILLAEEQGAALARRAEWEKTIRTGRALSVEVEVAGFEAAPGYLWQPNTRVRCEAPGVGVSSELLIAAATYRMDGSGRRTSMTLYPPEAYAPEVPPPQSRLARHFGRPPAATPDALGELV